MLTHTLSLSLSLFLFLSLSPSCSLTRAHSDTYVARLRRTVSWLNAHRYADGLTLCRNQKVRAQEVLDLKGAKTQW